MNKFEIFLAVFITLFSSSVFALSENDAALSLQTSINWIETHQNMDGSWGETDPDKMLYTTTVVDALYEANKLNAAYYAGVAWIENHAAINQDFLSRQVYSLAHHGNDTSAYVDRLVNNIQTVEGGEGWSLSGIGGVSVIDSAMVVKALYGREEASLHLAQDYLISKQAIDGSWSYGADDHIVASTSLTADVLLSLFGQKYFDKYENVTLRPDIIRTDPSLPEFFLSISPFKENLDLGRTYLEGQSAAITDIALLTKLTDTILKLENTSMIGAANLDRIKMVQDASGHIENDAYVTALYLSSLAQFLSLNDPRLKESLFLEDVALLNAVSASLGNNANDSIYLSSLNALTSLNLEGSGVTDLTGLEVAVNLVSLTLDANVAYDLSALLNAPWELSYSSTAFDGMALTFNGSLVDANSNSIPDYLEVTFGLYGVDVNLDSDGDGTSNYDEYQNGTHPNYNAETADTDGDGMLDQWELDYGLNPGDALDGEEYADLDGDYFSNYLEYMLGTLPNDINSREDELTITLDTDSWSVFDNLLTLREAVYIFSQEVNFAEGVDTHPKTIYLLPQTYVLNATGSLEDNSRSGDLDVLASNLTIVGDSTETTIIDGNLTDRIFDLRGAENFLLTDLTLKNGKIDGAIGGESQGAGLRAFDSGTITLQNLSVNNNAIVLTSGSGTNLGGAGLYLDKTCAAILNSEIAYNSISTDSQDADGAGIVLRGAGGCQMQITNSAIIHNTGIASDDSGGKLKGGGIALNGGCASLTDSRVDNNSLTGRNTKGGGIYVSGENCALDLNNTSVSFNSLLEDRGDAGEPAGGGIYANKSCFDIKFSDIKNNQTIGRKGFGAGIYSKQMECDAFISDSVISQNTSTGIGDVALHGGGAYFSESGLFTYEIKRTEISENGLIPEDDGADDEIAAGAGLYAEYVNLELAQSTISSNYITSTDRIPAFGAGVYLAADGNQLPLHANLESNTFTLNTIATHEASVSGGANVYVFDNATKEAFITLENNIFANDGTQAVSEFGWWESRDSSEGYNLFQTALLDNAIAVPEDLVGIDPMLAPLGDNGGFSRTHALLSGSPAIDTGSSTAGALDQRNYYRPQDGDGNGSALMDIGAMEKGFITNTVLNEYLHNLLSLPMGTLTLAMLDGVTSIDLSNSNITSLVDIEKVVNLQFLNLTNTQLDGLEPLIGMPLLVSENIIYTGIVLPASHDSDGDSKDDMREIATGYSPIDSNDNGMVDTDGDGVDDIDELFWLLDPLDPLDAMADTDGDGFSLGQELVEGTPPDNGAIFPEDGEYIIELEDEFNDAYYRTAFNDLKNTNRLDLKSDKTLGLRFSVPVSGFVTDARLVFVSAGSQSQTTDAVISVENSVDALLPDVTFTSRSYFNETQIWNIETWVLGLTHESSDFSSLVNLYLDQPGWVAGDHLFVMVSATTGDRKAEAYEESAVNAPKLKLQIDALPWDYDGDGVSDAQEIEDETDPLDPTKFSNLYDPNADTDGDGVLNGVETANGLDPSDPLDTMTDLDGDGFSLGQELTAGTDYSATTGGTDFPQASTQTIDLEGASNDAFIRTDNFDLKQDNKLELKSDRTVALRFPLILGNSSVSSAKLEFVAERAGTQTTDALISVESSADALIPDTSFLSRSYFTDMVTWSVESWTGGLSYQSPDITNLVNQYLAQSSWQSGNHIFIKISATSGDRKALSYESGVSQSPKLIMEISPTHWDFDGDGVGDVEEIVLGTDPLIFN